MAWGKISPSSHCVCLRRCFGYGLTGTFRQWQFQTRVWEQLNRGVSKPGGFQTGGFPTFSRKVQIVSRTLSGLFLVGAVNRPRKRKRTNRENARTIPEQIGKIPEKSGKSQKGQNPDLPFLAFLDFLAFFALQGISLLFWAFFPSFPGILGVRHGEKILAFLGGFSLLFPKRQGKEDQGVKVKKEGQVQIGEPPEIKPPRLAALEGCTPSCSPCAPAEARRWIFFWFFAGKFGKFSGKFGGNFAGFFLTHRTKAQKFRGKLRSILRNKIRSSKKIFRAKFTLQTCHLNKLRDKKIAAICAIAIFGALSLGQARKGAQTQTFGSGYLPVGWRSSTWRGQKLLGMSLETQGNQAFGRDIPGSFAGASRSKLYRGATRGAQWFRINWSKVEGAALEIFTAI